MATLNQIWRLFFGIVCLIGYVICVDKEFQFTEQPISEMTQLDREVILRCSVNRREAQISWLINNRPILPNRQVKIKRGRMAIRIPRYESSSLLDMKLSDIGKSQFQCVARHQQEVILSRPVKISIAKLDDFPQNENGERVLHVNIGTVAVLPCALPASVPAALPEYKLNNGQLLDRSKDRHKLFPSGTLHILNVQMSDAGRYRCIAYNAFLNERRNSSSEWFLSVNTPFSYIPQPLQFVVRPPLSIEAIRGTNVTLECATNLLPAEQVFWRRDGVKTLNDPRYERVGSSLRIIGLSQEDEGSYICSANGSYQTIEARTNVRMLEPPSIIHPLKDINFLADHTVRLNCNARGRPVPEYSWFRNGEEITHEMADNSQIQFESQRAILFLKRARTSDQGVYQCFAKNELATDHSTARLHIRTSLYSYQKKPTLEHSFESSVPLPSNNKVTKLVGPSKPIIHRMTPDSVMVSWNETTSSSAVVSFYKLQYRMFTPNSSWITLEDEIGPHTTSFAVNNLQTDSQYKFRLIAVYPNNEQALGKASSKFRLLSTLPYPKPHLAPYIISAKPINSSTIELYWKSENSPSVNGYFIHYRLTQSAESYHKRTIKGGSVESAQIAHLQPNREYEIKMQCFNAAGGSDFSNQITVRTFPDSSSVDNDSDDLDEGDAIGGSDTDEDEEEPKELQPVAPKNQIPGFNNVGNSNGPAFASENESNVHRNIFDFYPSSPVPSSSTSERTWPPSSSTTTSTTTTTTTTTTTDASFGRHDFDFSPTSSPPINSINKQIDPELDSNDLNDRSGDGTYNRRQNNITPTFDDEFYKQLIPIVAIAASSLLMFICCILQCRRSMAQRRKRKQTQQAELMAQKEALYASRGSLRRSAAIVPTNGPVFTQTLNGTGNYMTIGGSRAALNSSRLAMNGNAPMNLNGSIRLEPVYGMTGGTLGRHSTKPLLQSHTVATLDRHRQRIRQFEDHYSTGQQFATINRSNSFVRLNGTLERKRRSRPDLFSVMDMKDSVTLTTNESSQPSWPAGPGLMKQPIYGESKLNHYTIAEEN